MTLLSCLICARELLTMLAATPVGCCREIQPALSCALFFFPSIQGPTAAAACSSSESGVIYEVPGGVGRYVLRAARAHSPCCAAAAPPWRTPALLVKDRHTCALPSAAPWKRSPRGGENMPALLPVTTLRVCMLKPKRPQYRTGQREVTTLSALRCQGGLGRCPSGGQRGHAPRRAWSPSSWPRARFPGAFRGTGMVRRPRRARWSLRPSRWRC